MNKTEALQLMLKYLMPRIEPYGFKSPGKGTEFQIKRKTKNGEDRITGGFTDYNPVQQIIYGAGKRDLRILNILNDLQAKGIMLSPPISRYTGTLGVSYEALHQLNYIGYLPHMETEADVEKCVKMMFKFLEETAVPLLDKFEDLRELDQVINGDDPWPTDSNESYRFGGNFFEKRVIIAKLANNPNYESLIDFTYRAAERLSTENGYPFVYDRNDLTKPLPALVHLLRDVKPLY